MIKYQTCTDIGNVSTGWWWLEPWNFMTFHSHHRIDMKIAVGDINGDIGDMGLSYLVGGLEHLVYFSIYWECHHPNWLINIFQRGRSTTNQIYIYIWVCLKLGDKPRRPFYCGNVWSTLCGRFAAAVSMGVWKSREDMIRPYIILHLYEYIYIYT